MTTTVLNTQHIKVEVSIIDGMVFITNTYSNTKRTTSFQNIEEAINNTTMPPVKNYLMSL